MSTFARHLNYSFAEYLELEQASAIKHEYFSGEIFAMAGGTPEHAALIMSVGGRLLAALSEKPCTVFSSDLRVRVLATGLATYPDVTVVCGPRQTDPESDATVTNPTLVVEVLSGSTERYDRGEKFEQYKKIPGLQTVVFVEQNASSIDVWARIERGDWQLTRYRSGQAARLDSIGCTLDVDAVYSVIRR